KDLIKNESLNIATQGSTFIILPFLISKPAGVFINELTAVIKKAEKEPPIITGILIKKCVHLLLNLSQVYKYILKKIASKKNANVSINNGNAITWPPICINVGHNNDSCNPIIVPVTTPTATVIV